MGLVQPRRCSGAGAAAGVGARGWAGQRVGTSRARAIYALSGGPHVGPRVPPHTAKWHGQVFCCAAGTKESAGFSGWARGRGEASSSPSALQDVMTGRTRRH